MAKDSKFGTFGGVFTPSILTILGVIMYLRLPWVVGTAGLYSAVGIVLVAHVISVSTGLSISSIATDKTVGAGGPYYIVSRSLGLPIGGTLGLALFIGLCFSISLYVIGFCESFLSFFAIEQTANAIRIAGTAVLIVLTAVTLISTAFAIKTQYLILTLIALSLVSIFLGSPEHVAAKPNLKPVEGANLALLFGIFFPAVTGFTAGVNMSGDLRDPRRAIPRGTMAAILAGMAVYVGLAWFLAARVPTKQLIDDPEVLQNIAAVPALVVAGIWGATLSSGLGSILGAPRILQATAVDRITPRFFGKGSGKTNEPRNALMLAFVIAEGGILIAELDAIARIVSMVFLTTYGFLNISCAIESWASPDFRPAFRIPRSISVVGAITCMVIMIQLDLPAMLGATALMVGLFLYLKRKQLTLDSGDTWEGIWSSLVRSGLYRLSQERAQKRNWRPNILMLTAEGSEVRAPLRDFASSLITGNGILTDFEVVDARKGETAQFDQKEEDDDDTRLGIFKRRLPVNDVYDDVADLCRFHGFAGLKPNTVLMNWYAFSKDRERFGQLLDTVSELDFNLLLYARNPERKLGDKRRIDVWWAEGRGNMPLSLALLRFVTAASAWQESEVRFLILSPDSASNDALRTTTRRLLRESRMEAGIRVVNSPVDELEDRIREESSEADLALIGLPLDSGACGPDLQERTESLLESMSRVLLIRSSSTFEEVLSLGRAPSVSFLPPAAGTPGELELPEIEIPDSPDLAREVSAFAEAWQRSTSAFHDECIKRLYGEEINLIRRVKEVAEKHFAQLEKGLSGANPRRQKNLVNRVQSSFLLECKGAIEQFESKALDVQRTALEARIEAFLEDEKVVDRSAKPKPLVVQRAAEDFKVSEKDSAYLRSFKRQRKLVAWFTRQPITYKLPAQRLRAYYFDKAIRELLFSAVRQTTTDSHQLAIQLGKLLNSSRASLSLLGDEIDTTEEVLDLVGSQKARTLEHLQELVAHHKERVNRHQWELLVQARELARSYAADIARLDVALLVDNERRVSKDHQAVAAELSEAAQNWFEAQRALFGRAKLGLELSGFQHRLASMAQREKEAAVLGVKNGALAECEKLSVALDAYASAIDELGQAARLEVHLDFKNRFDPQPVIDNLVRETAESTAELPETVVTLSDESLQQLEEGASDVPEMIDLSLRRLVQFLVESELVGGLQEVLSTIPPAEQRAMGIAQDIVRLITFQQTEIEALGDQEAETFRSQMKPVVESSRERLATELSALRSIAPKLERTLGGKLGLVLDRTNAYDLSSATANLDQNIRLHQGMLAVSGAQSFLRRGLAQVKESMVRLLYRRSAGQVLARRLRSESRAEGKVVDRVLELVAKSTPKPDTVDSLPFYYRQLFFGQSAINDSFWVGRKDQLARVRRAIASYRRGTHGALVVVGERGSGKTALCQRIITEFFERSPVYRVHPVPGGSADPDRLDEAIAKAYELDADADELLAGTAPGSVVVIDDLELWWERQPDGFAAIDRLIEHVERYSDRCLFLIACNTHAFQLINRFRPLSDHALALLECGPLPAEALESIVTLRHASTGLKFELGGSTEDQLSHWRLARLFSKHFDYSGGYVGPALRSWITHVERVNDGTISVRVPEPKGWEVLDELRTDWTALLLELLLHKQLTPARIARVTGLAPARIRNTLETMERMGLATESRQHVVELNPFLSHVVVERFVRRGLLS